MSRSIAGALKQSRELYEMSRRVWGDSRRLLERTKQLIGRLPGLAFLPLREIVSVRQETNVREGTVPEPLS